MKPLSIFLFTIATFQLGCSPNREKQGQVSSTISPPFIWEGEYKHPEASLTIANLKPHETFEYLISYRGSSACSGVKISGLATISSDTTAVAGDDKQNPTLFTLRKSKIIFVPSCCDGMVGMDCLRVFFGEFEKENAESKPKEAAKSDKQEPQQTLDTRLKFNEIKFQLIDASQNKCIAVLGDNADKVGYLFVGRQNKIACIYKNKVVDNGEVKHLVLFMRSINGVQKPTVEKVYAVRDGERAYYGIHYVLVQGDKFISNSQDFAY